MSRLDQIRSALEQIQSVETENEQLRAEIKDLNATVHTLSRLLSGAKAEHQVVVVEDGTLADCTVAEAARAILESFPDHTGHFAVVAHIASHRGFAPGAELRTVTETFSRVMRRASDQFSRQSDGFYCLTESETFLSKDADGPLRGFTAKQCAIEILSTASDSGLHFKAVSYTHLTLPTKA